MVQHKAQDVNARPRTEDIQITEDINFKTMLLPKPILEGLKKSGYITPSPVQRKALPLVRCGFDLIVQAKAGTGKTCVFTIAALELVNPKLQHLQAVVLAPTREIALQITDVINAIGQAINGLKVHCFIGGYPVSQDMKNAVGCHIAVGAPGRLQHLVHKGILKTKHVRLFVLDEADKLMEKSFVNNINEIFALLPETKQVLACSATYTPELLKFLSNYMHRGQFITPYQGADTTLLIGIRQYVSILPDHVNKLAKMQLKEKHLLYLLRSVSFNQCLVFTNLHTRAESVCNILRNKDWSVEWIAGRQEQAERETALAQLKNQRVRVLVTTDLTARGIDLENVNLVINLDLPKDHQTYLHRMGRAGRYGSHGMVITIVSTGTELLQFHKQLGAIGGSSLCVNCVPDKLKNVDLWTIANEDLQQVYGIVEPPENVSNSLEDSEDSTDTDEKFSQESSSSDELEDTVIDECNGGDFARDTYVDNIYEAAPTDIEVVSGPVLLTVTKKEDHWRDVLPVVVVESKLPLNTPVVLLDTKLVRIKSWVKNQSVTTNTATPLPDNQVIDFESKCDDYCDKFYSFEEIKSFVESGIKFEIDLENNLCDGEIFSFQEIAEMLEKSVSETQVGEKNGSKYESVKEVLMKYETSRGKLENDLMGLDSFDIVGWMAVDEKHNILENLKIDNNDIFKFELIKTSTGNNQIKVVPSFICSPEEKSCDDCIDHISTLRLEGFNLSTPFSLAKIAEMLTLYVTTNLLPTAAPVKNVGVTTKQTTEKRNKRDFAVKEFQFGLKNDMQKINGKNPINKKDSKNPPKFTENKIVYRELKKKKTVPEKFPNVPFFKKSAFINNSEERSKKNYTSVNGASKSPSVYDTATVANSHGKIKQTKKSYSYKREEDTAERSINPVSENIDQCKENSETLPVNSTCQLVKNSKSIKTGEEDNIITESSSEHDSSASRLSEEDFNPCSVRNGEATPSSASSEDSGPYVDMSQNLMKWIKWQELHDIEESDSCSESDVLCPVGPHRVRDSYSDTTNCSYETSLRHKGLHCKTFKHGRSKVKKHLECKHSRVLHKDSLDSYDSKESENSNHHSFRTACSQHYGSGEDYNKDHAYVPTCSHIESYENGDLFAQVPTCFHHNRRESPKVLYRCQERTCPQSEKHARQEKTPQNVSYQGYDFHQHGCRQGTNTHTGESSKIPNSLTSPNLFTDWYSTWYAEVRYRADHLAMTEYINTLSTL